MAQFAKWYAAVVFSENQSSSGRGERIRVTTSKSRTSPKPSWIKDSARFDLLIDSDIVGKPSGQVMGKRAAPVKQIAKVELTLQY